MDTKRVLARLLIFTYYIISLTVSAQIQDVMGQLITIENFDSQYVPSRNIYIWLPDDYTKKQKYNVLYFNDGQMLFDPTNTWNHQEWRVDETLSELLKLEIVEPTIVVGIESKATLRHSEYFPQKPFEKLSTSLQDSIYNQKRNANTPLFTQSVNSDAYLKFLVKELVPYINTQYSTSKNFKNTFIAGSSMGGLISLYAMCEYPKIFGGAICMSTHWPGVLEMENNPIPALFFNYIEKNLPSLNNHKIYFDYGNKGLDKNYEPYQKRVDNIIINRKNALINWRSKFFDGADHSENSWAKRLSIPLEFMLNP